LSGTSREGGGAAVGSDAPCDECVERSFRVASALGMHARPAGRFVTVAARYESEIEVARGDEWVSGRSVLSILSLAATQGTELRVRATGQDAEEAVTALGDVLETPEEEAG